MKQPSMCMAIDIVNSSKMNKEILNQELHALIKKLNEGTATLIQPFTIRNGDEVIGLFSTFNDTLPLIEIVHWWVEKYETGCYVGLGIGYIETSATNVHEMNGSAVLSAVAAQKESKERTKRQKSPSITVRFHSVEVPAEPVQALYDVLENIQLDWTEKQRKVIQLKEEHPNWTLERIGESLGLRSPRSATSHHLSRANYSTVHKIKKSMDELLSYYSKVL